MDERLLTDDVVRAAAAGDGGAFRVVYDVLSPAVFGYLKAKGVADPEGVTSDVFLGVLPRLSAVTGGAEGLRRLVFSIAHARMVDEHRARARRPLELVYDPDLDTRSARPAESEALDSLGEQWAVELLSVLPADQRDVLLLRVVADLSIEQVAEIMERSPGAVKQLQRRGLLTIRQVLDERRVTR